jgi:long-chain acyl-CoA synthetase
VNTAVAPGRDSEFMPLHEQLTAAFRRHADREALLAGDNGITFAELDRAVDTMCVPLRAQGLGPGRRLAIMAKARPQFVVALLATLRLGAAVVLVSPAWKGQEIRHAVALTRPMMVASDHDTLGLFAAEFDGPALDLDVITVPDAQSAANGTGARCFPEPGHEWAGAEAAHVFSSGTTGLPKAVVHTHGTLGAATRDWARHGLDLTESDRFQIATPPAHILGLLNIFAALSSGSTIRLHPRFNVDEMLRCIEADRLTLEMTIAPIALALAEHPDLEQFDLSSLRYFMWCATPVVSSVAQSVTDRTGVRFVAAYGASEFPLISANIPTAADTWRIDTAGRVIEHVDVRVVDTESGDVLALGETGEIQARGRSMMIGYLPQEATAGSIVDGWYRTGDIGWLEPDGWLHITDRLKEMIKVKGFQVAPAEVEAVILNHPRVVDCAVFGVPDQATGEAVIAAVVAASGQPVTTVELQQHVVATLAKYKVPNRVEFIDAIPRTASGKVLRRTLRERLATGTGQRG